MHRTACGAPQVQPSCPSSHMLVLNRCLQAHARRADREPSSRAGGRAPSLQEKGSKGTDPGLPAHVLCRARHYAAWPCVHHGSGALRCAWPDGRCGTPACLRAACMHARRWMDAGKFLTGFSAVGSLAIPAILAHAKVGPDARTPACWPADKLTAPAGPCKRAIRTVHAVCVCTHVFNCLRQSAPYPARALLPLRC